MWQRLLPLCVKGYSGRFKETDKPLSILSASSVLPASRLSIAVMSNPAQLHISSSHPPSLSSSVWHPHRGGKMESSVCLSRRKVISRAKASGRRGMKDAVKVILEWPHHKFLKKHNNCIYLKISTCFFLYFNLITEEKHMDKQFAVKKKTWNSDSFKVIFSFPVITLINFFSKIAPCKMIKRPWTAAKLATWWDVFLDAVSGDRAEPKRMTRLAHGYLWFWLIPGRRKIKTQDALKIIWLLRYLDRNILKPPYVRLFISLFFILDTCEKASND